MIVERHCVCRPHLLRVFERKFTSTERDHSRATDADQLSQQCPKKSYANDRNYIVFTDVAPLKNIHHATEGLARERVLVECLRKFYRGGRFADIPLGVGTVGKDRDAIAFVEIANCAADF